MDVDFGAEYSIFRITKDSTSEIASVDISPRVFTTPGDSLFSQADHIVYTIRTLYVVNQITAQYHIS